MKIKIHTFIKGAIWELLGALVLSAYVWWTTGDLDTASKIGIGYPIFRAFMWYPYERVFKRIRRRRCMSITIECKDQK